MKPLRLRPSASICLITLLLFLSPSSIFAASTNREVEQILRQQLEQIAVQGRTPLSHEPIHQKKFLADAYMREGFKLLWTRPEQARQLLAGIADSKQDGLRPEDYHQQALVLLGRKMEQQHDAATAGEYDILLTDALLSLGHDKLYGKTDPKIIETTWNLNNPRKEAYVRPLLNALKEDRLPRMLPRLGPVQPFYADLKEALATYQTLAARGGWPRVPDGPVLKPGMQEPRVEALRRRLLATGELQRIGEQPQLFDETLNAAVKSFQVRHYLEPDGIVGKTVLAALNVPVEERINQMRVNLERARWVFHDVPNTFVIVDIAGFSLQYRYQGALAWSTRVVVGQPFNQTPIFRSDIRSMVLNPTWTVPAAIVNKEMVPNMLKNPGYLKKQNLRILDASEREIPATAIDFKKYANKPFPYTLRQDAGVDGALGRIKFLFPNPYSVYLHDTPSKALFGKTSRAFSHGCIRVQNPLELGKLLLNNDTGNPVNAAAVDRMLAQGDTKSIPLKTPVPVILMYWTAQVKEGKVWFKPDLYQRDSRVLQALNARFDPPKSARASQ